MHSDKPTFLDIERLTLENQAYLRVLETTETMQVTVMRLTQGETIPREIHAGVTQFIRVERGSVEVYTRGYGGMRVYVVPEDSSVVIPPGVAHEVHPRTPDVRLYAIYAYPSPAFAPHDKLAYVERLYGGPRLRGATD